MEPFRRQPHLQDGRISRQDGVQRSVQVTQVMPPSRFKANDLPLGVNPPICPTSTHHPRLDPGNTLQCSLELSLNRPLMGLDLKAVKVGTIILDFGPAPTRFKRL